MLSSERVGMRAILDMVAVVFLQTGGSQEFPPPDDNRKHVYFLLWPHTADWTALTRLYLCL